MRIDDPQITPDRAQAFRDAGHWVDTTTNEVLAAHACHQPDSLAVVDARVRLSYAEYHRRALRLRQRRVRRQAGRERNHHRMDPDAHDGGTQ